MPAIAFTTANFVARETGWAMHGWMHGDGATQEYFRGLDTYEERLNDMLAIARDALERHGLRVATYAMWVDPANVARACELAGGIGTNVIGAGFSGEPEALAPVLGEHGVRLAVENHPERTPG